VKQRRSQRLPEKREPEPSGQPSTKLNEVQFSRAALQVANSASYFRPYVAEYTDPDFPDDFGDRVCFADSRGSDAETKKRGIGSSFRERCHREHFWSSDRNGSY